MHCSSTVLMGSAFSTHQEFTVLLLVYVLITKDVAGTHHSQLARFLHDGTHFLATILLLTGYETQSARPFLDGRPEQAC